MDLLLYEHPLSSYAQKVKIALREKGLSFRAETPDSFGTGRTDTPLAAANPRAEVPVLIDGQTRLFESTVILDISRSAGPSRLCCRAILPHALTPASPKMSATPSTKR